MSVHDCEVSNENGDCAYGPYPDECCRHGTMCCDCKESIDNFFGTREEREECCTYDDPPYCCAE